MSLTDRILPPDEWHKLDGRDLSRVLALLNPANTQIVVVENEAGAIVGCWASVLILHAEGVWIAPEYRTRTSVARRLWRRMRDLVLASGARAVVTAADSPQITTLLDRQGAQPLPQEYVLCLQSPL